MSVSHGFRWYMSVLPVLHVVEPSPSYRQVLTVVRVCRVLTASLLIMVQAPGGFPSSRPPLICQGGKRRIGRSLHSRLHTSLLLAGVKYYIDRVYRRLNRQPRRTDITFMPPGRSDPSNPSLSRSVGRIAYTHTAERIIPLIGGMPTPELSPMSEEGLLLPIKDQLANHNMESESTANNILASVKEQELQFERLTRELEVERQIVANQLERCRLGAESPGAASGSSSEKSLHWRPTDVSSAADAKPVREQLSLCSPEQSSLHEKSVGNSRSSTQMNSYSDSGYQDAGSYYGSQNVGRTDSRLPHSYPGGGPAASATLMRNSRAEGQASTQ
ncbi:plakophilin-4 isoform X9, partial [Clarias magur]